MLPVSGPLSNKVPVVRFPVLPAVTPTMSLAEARAIKLGPAPPVRVVVIEVISKAAGKSCKVKKSASFVPLVAPVPIEGELPEVPRLPLI